MVGSGQDINPTLLSDSDRRADCLPAFRVLLDRAARPSGSRALGRLLVAAAAALVAAATAADATPATARLQSPQTSEIARAGAIMDSKLTPAGASRIALSASWGGVYRTPSGEQVKVFASSTYPQDPAVGQRWADFFAGLVHGSELATITTYLAPLTEVQGLCGAQALACYSPRDALLVAPGDDPYSDTSAEAVVTHEYGHHVAANRVNPPWQAVDWGAKRWASYLQVCAKTKQATFFPGSETLPNYRSNPGEGWAESYRVLNQRKASLTESPWEIVVRAFYPDDTALARLEQDVVTPWTAPTTESRTGSVTAKTRVRSYTVATPLDGTLRVSLKGARAARLTLDLFSGTTRIGHAVKTANATATTTSVTVCGQRSVGIRVARTSGAGTFALAVSKP
ncbi:MAG: hypothetical protein ABI948_03040 [Thermoleophilia bacterium]